MPRYRLAADGSLVPEGRRASSSGSAAWSGGSSRAWRRLRAATLARDGRRCRRCGRGAYLGHELEAHHVVPRALGGPDHTANLVTLGRSCHDEADAEARRQAKAASSGERRIGRVLS